MDIQSWDEVVILEDNNGWQGLHTVCDMVGHGMAFLWHLKFPEYVYIVTEENRNRVQIIKD